MSWLSNWIDARVKTAVDEVSADIQKDLTVDMQAALTDIEAKIGALPDAVAASIGALITTAQNDLKQDIAVLPNLDQFEQAVTSAIKSITGGLLTKNPNYRTDDA